MSHYSLAQNPEKLSNWAKRMAISILNNNISHPVLVYTGMSGISSGTALSLALYKLGVVHGMMYVRKSGEVSHGDEVEYENIWTYSEVVPTPIFCDDHISSGDTRRRCESYSEQYGLGKFKFQALQGWDFNTFEIQPIEESKGMAIEIMNTWIDEINKNLNNKFLIENPLWGIPSFESFTIHNSVIKTKEKKVKTNTIPFWANDWRKQSFARI